MLEVSDQENAPRLPPCPGFSLTAAIAEHDGPSYFRFASPVGPAVHSALDAAIKSLSPKYTNFNVIRVEFAFTGSAAGHDDPAIGLATGVLLRSMIDGFPLILLWRWQATSPRTERSRLSPLFPQDCELPPKRAAKLF